MVARRSHGVFSGFALDVLEDLLVQYINGVISSLGKAIKGPFVVEFCTEQLQAESGGLLR